MPEVGSLCSSSLLLSDAIPFDGDHPSGDPDHPSGVWRKVVAFSLEWVVAFQRNQWSPSTGMGGRLQPEYAGKKELLGVADGYRESEQSWQELLLDLRSRGLVVDPELAVGDGALGFWKALPKVYPNTRPQRCWVHKTVNVLNKDALEQPGQSQVDAPRHLDGVHPRRG